MEENNSSNIALQNLTEYQLTEKEKILLEILLNPEYRTKSVTDMCKLANCSRVTYYEAFQKPGFVAIYEQKTKDLVKQYIGPVINSVAREAVRGSYNHAKMILEMAGLYSEKLEISQEVTVTVDDRRARIAELMSKPSLIEAIPTTTYKIVENGLHNDVLEEEKQP